MGQGRNKSAMLWHSYSSPVRVRYVRKNGHFDTQGYKTGGLKTYLSPGLASVSKSGGERFGILRVYIKPFMGTLLASD